MTRMEADDSNVDDILSAEERSIIQMQAKKKKIIKLEKGQALSQIESSSTQIIHLIVLKSKKDVPKLIVNNLLNKKNYTYYSISANLNLGKTGCMIVFNKKFYRKVYHTSIEYIYILTGLT